MGLVCIGVRHHSHHYFIDGIDQAAWVKISANYWP
jgi:hypothetical protein